MAVLNVYDNLLSALVPLIADFFTVGIFGYGLLVRQSGYLLSTSSPNSRAWSRVIRHAGTLLLVATWIVNAVAYIIWSDLRYILVGVALLNAILILVEMIGSHRLAREQRRMLRAEIQLMKELEKEREGGGPTQDKSRAVEYVRPEEVDPQMLIDLLQYSLVQHQAFLNQHNIPSISAPSVAPETACAAAELRPPCTLPGQPEPSLKIEDEQENVNEAQSSFKIEVPADTPLGAMSMTSMLSCSDSTELPQQHMEMSIAPPEKSGGYCSGTTAMSIPAAPVMVVPHPRFEQQYQSICAAIVVPSMPVESQHWEEEIEGGGEVTVVVEVVKDSQGPE
ncbi:hypothetical protein BGW38_008067 [Lunasporangiospora selenospora]|uniref:Uncharacterized protein n=1 Tax=Lunasporangiospora selenospora TaxID=979761 RepID=A0A9P6FXZ5_9FUNG|nr:hypothetical protein BGW38_008067 [Lunasporangiospora selenospora]